MEKKKTELTRRTFMIGGLSLLAATSSISCLELEKPAFITSRGLSVSVPSWLPKSSYVETGRIIDEYLKNFETAIYDTLNTQNLWIFVNKDLGSFNYGGTQVTGIAELALRNIKVAWRKEAIDEPSRNDVLPALPHEFAHFYQQQIKGPQDHSSWPTNLEQAIEYANNNSSYFAEELPRYV